MTLRMLIASHTGIRRSKVWLIALLSAVAIAVGYSLRARHSRPMFAPLSESDRSRLQHVISLSDSEGNEVFFDLELNIVVALIQTQRHRYKLSRPEVSPDSAIFCKGSADEFIVPRATNTLVLAKPAETPIRISLANGEAARWYLDKEFRSSSSLATPTLRESIDTFYSGPQRDAVHQFLKREDYEGY